MRRTWLAAVLGGALVVQPMDVMAQTYLVVVSGIGGEPKYSHVFEQWCTTLVSAARDRFHLPDESIVYLAESPGRQPGVAGKSTRQNVEAALNSLATRAEPAARIFIVLVGHGSAVGGQMRFNLPGPDMTAEDFAAVLSRFPTQEIVFVNLSSASGGFIPALSGERRTIVTATKSGFERNETIFPGHFVDAFAGDGADTDKDERVSVLEAFNYARREVARAYDSENRLLTEHALLDDDGDGRGSAEPDPRSGDGGMAVRLFLDDPTQSAGVISDPALVALYKEKEQQERQLAALRSRKDQMEAEVYQRELERLLLELARTSRAIREREGKQP